MGKNNTRLTTKQFIEKAQILHGDKYDYSQVDYINNHTKIKIGCKRHGEFNQTPGNHLSGKGCCYCANESKVIRIKETFSKMKRKTTPPLGKEEFVRRSVKIHGDGKYDYSLVEYKRADTKVKIICPDHGIFLQSPNSHFLGSDCPICSNKKIAEKQKMPLSEFILKAAKIHRKFYDYSLVDYKNNNTKVRIICPIHGVFEQTPNKHLSGQKCKKCRFSSGEKRILSILDDNKIKYEYQKSVTITKRKLRFDFFLPEFDLYIEYQGQQHFRGVSIFGGQTEFEKGIERDAIKRQYIKNTGSNLLEIPYWKFNDIEKILIKKIKNIRKGRQIFEAQNQMRMFV